MSYSPSYMHIYITSISTTIIVYKGTVIFIKIHHMLHIEYFNLCYVKTFKTVTKISVR